MRAAVAMLAAPLLSGCGLVLDWGPYGEGGAGGGTSVTAGSGSGGSGGDESLCGGCPDGQICEDVEDGSHACLPPVTITGSVLSLKFPSESLPVADKPLSAARVVLLDPESRRALAPAAFTEADGTFKLTISTRRDLNGLPRPQKATVFIEARDHYRYPDYVRRAPLFDLTDTTLVAAMPTLELGAIDLYYNDMSNKGPTLRGRVESPVAAGAIVAASIYGDLEGGPSNVGATIADSHGDYVLYNVWFDPTYPEGAVSAYTKGMSFTSAMRNFEEGEDLTGLDLEESGVATGSVQGSFGGAGDFPYLTARLTVDYDLPIPGLVTEPTQYFDFQGVPAGTFSIMPAMEEDGYNPDYQTGIVAVTVKDGMVDAGAVPVNPAITVLSPHDLTPIECPLGQQTTVNVQLVDVLEDEVEYEISIFAAVNWGGGGIGVGPQTGGVLDFKLDQYLRPRMAYSFDVRAELPDGKILQSEPSASFLCKEVGSGD